MSQIFKHERKINLWKCEKVAVFEGLIREKSIALEDKCNQIRKERDEFWDNHPVLKDLRKPLYYYYHKYDVLRGDIPGSGNLGNLWELFRDCVTNVPLTKAPFSLTK